jgi:N6-L-threonylcarbamoyladenine synthase
MKILGIETSADETGVSLIEASGDFGKDFTYHVRGNAVISQMKVHEQYGGIYPNIAKREHQRALVPVLAEVLRQANEFKPIIDESANETAIEHVRGILEREPELAEYFAQFLRNYGKPDIDCVAVTYGPGLEPALWVGVNFARALAYLWQVPIVGVNHMEGHIMLSAAEDGALAKFQFPLLSLLISGGHTELQLSREWMQYELLGATRDDAVGEGFDKAARLLGLPYPGGPQISRLAREAREKNLPRAVELPRPMISTDNFDFSFAGLKTAVRRVVEANQPLSDTMKMQIAREFEDAAADVLVAKTLRAIEEYGAKTVLVGGGVSANTHIRSHLADAIQNYGYGTKLLIPPPELATDNALMIALAGYFHAQKEEFVEPDALRANGNLSL